MLDSVNVEEDAAEDQVSPPLNLPMANIPADLFVPLFSTQDFLKGHPQALAPLHLPFFPHIQMLLPLPLAGQSLHRLPPFLQQISLSLFSDMMSL